MENETASRDYFYPLLFLTPGFEDEAIRVSPFSLARRKWQTSIFDFATLATKHKLHLPYQAMDVFLARCNIELRVSGHATMEKANRSFNLLRVGLYASGVTPFLCPFITSYSINEYSGINSRDSESLRAKLPPGMDSGLTSEMGTLEAWPFELSFQCTVIPARGVLTADVFRRGVATTETLQKLLQTYPRLEAAVDASLAAPSLGNLAQSLLHIWSALEALFPSVSTEVSFRLALYITQLVSTAGQDRPAYHESVRAAYGLRSQIAHGAKRDISFEEWQAAWTLLMDCFNALLRRGHLPSEKELLGELLA